MHLFIQVWKPELSQGKIQVAAYCAEPHPPLEAMDSSVFIVPVYFIYAGVAPRQSKYGLSELRTTLSL
jgi:hypothetical protein